MTDTIPVTIRLSSEKAALLSHIADQEERSRSYLLREAVDLYLQKHQQWVTAIHEAIEEAESRQTIPLRDAFAALRDSE